MNSYENQARTMRNHETTLKKRSHIHQTQTDSALSLNVWTNRNTDRLRIVIIYRLSTSTMINYDHPIEGFYQNPFNTLIHSQFTFLRYLDPSHQVSFWSSIHAFGFCFCIKDICGLYLFNVFRIFVDYFHSGWKACRQDLL